MNDAIRIEYMLLGDLQKHPRNPKDHDLGAIGKSVNRFGFTAPILMDERTGKMVAGHGRLDTLVSLRSSGQDAPKNIQTNAQGEWLVPVVRGLSFNSDAEVEAYLIADNRLTEIGGWDNAELAGLLQDLANDDYALMEVTGFDGHDLDMMLKDLGEGLDFDTGNATNNPASATNHHEGVEPDNIESHVRMVYLYMSDSNIDEFSSMTVALGDIYETDNLTDTIREAVKREYENHHS